MSLVLALASLAGLGLSVLVHVAALLGNDVTARFPYVWLLHVGIFFVFVPFVFIGRKFLGSKPTLSTIQGGFPRWVVALGIAICAYAAVNFALFIVATADGGASVRDGRFVLENHGRFVRELTKGEYAALKAHEIRGFSGHWMVFYYVPFAYFMFYKKSNPSIEQTA